MDRTFIKVTRVRCIEVPTFVDAEGGYTGNAKLTGNIVKITRGTWDANRGDSHAVVHMSTGERVETALFYGDFEAAPLSALAGREVTHG